MLWNQRDPKDVSSPLPQRSQDLWGNNVEMRKEGIALAKTDSVVKSAFQEFLRATKECRIDVVISLEGCVIPNSTSPRKISAFISFISFEGLIDAVEGTLIRALDDAAPDGVRVAACAAPSEKWIAARCGHENKAARWNAQYFECAMEVLTDATRELPCVPSLSKKQTLSVVVLPMPRQIVATICLKGDAGSNTDSIAMVRGYLNECDSLTSLAHGISALISHQVDPSQIYLRNHDLRGTKAFVALNHIFQVPSHAFLHCTVPRAASRQTNPTTWQRCSPMHTSGSKWSAEMSPFSTTFARAVMRSQSPERRWPFSFRNASVLLTPRQSEGPSSSDHYYGGNIVTPKNHNRNTGETLPQYSERDDVDASRKALDVVSITDKESCFRFPTGTSRRDYHRTSIVAEPIVCTVSAPDAREERRWLIRLAASLLDQHPRAKYFPTTSGISTISNVVSQFIATEGVGHFYPLAPGLLLRLRAMINEKMGAGESELPTGIIDHLQSVGSREGVLPLLEAVDSIDDLSQAVRHTTSILCSAPRADEDAPDHEIPPMVSAMSSPSQVPSRQMVLTNPRFDFRSRRLSCFASFGFDIFSGTVLATSQSLGSSPEGSSYRPIQASRQRHWRRGGVRPTAEDERYCIDPLAEPPFRWLLQMMHTSGSHIVSAETLPLDALFSLKIAKSTVFSYIPPILIQFEMSLDDVSDVGLDSYQRVLIQRFRSAARGQKLGPLAERSTYRIGIEVGGVGVESSLERLVLWKTFTVPAGLLSGPKDIAETYRENF
jgi:hypothetical protein